MPARRSRSAAVRQAGPVPSTRAARAVQERNLLSAAGRHVPGFRSADRPDSRCRGGGFAAPAIRQGDAAEDLGTRNRWSERQEDGAAAIAARNDPDADAGLDSGRQVLCGTRRAGDHARGLRSQYGQDAGGSGRGDRRAGACNRGKVPDRRCQAAGPVQERPDLRHGRREIRRRPERADLRRQDRQRWSRACLVAGRNARHRWRREDARPGPVGQPHARAGRLHDGQRIGARGDVLPQPGWAAGA